jgi:hypothetical protein
MENKEKPVVMTRGVEVITHQGSVRASVYPINHPRERLNHAPYVTTSEVQEIRLITRNTEYVWKKSHQGEQKEEHQSAKNQSDIPEYLFNALIT